MTYWSSEAGARHRRRHRQRMALLARVYQEPVRKGNRGRATAADFRSAMGAEIADHPGWPRPRARLAVDLNFATSQRQPPNLEKLAKHYLDQLGATHDQGEGGHLYCDDRQVQLLHVYAHHGWDLEGSRYPPGIWVSAQTAAEAAVDMHEASALPNDDDRYDIDNLEWESLREQLREAERLSRSTYPHLRRSAPLMRFMALRHAQELLLQRNDRWLEHIFWDASPYLLCGKQARQGIDASAFGVRLREIEQSRHTMTRGILLGLDPHSIALPPLPGSPGEGERFRAGIRDAIRGYVDQVLILFPLLVPTRLTVVVVQPKQARDLDNILLDLLPVVDDIMRPPQEPWLLSAASSVGEIRDDDPMAERKQRGLRRLKSVIEHGVWSAQLIELNRTDDDPPEGALAMMLGHGESMRSLWAEALARLEDWDEREHDDW